VAVLDVLAIVVEGEGQNNDDLPALRVRGRSTSTEAAAATGFYSGAGGTNIIIFIITT
jgi:hypothetical protein